MSRPYVDNPSNRRLGRVGMPVGSMPVPRGSSGGSGSGSSTKTYVDNPHNRRLGRVGMAHGTAVVSRSGSSSHELKMSKTYVGNASNRPLGHSGMPVGSMPVPRGSPGGISSGGSTETYVDNSYKPNLGRVGTIYVTAGAPRSGPLSSYEKIIILDADPVEGVEEMSINLDADPGEGVEEMSINLEADPGEGVEGFTNSATSWHQGGKQQPSAGKGGFGGSFASPNRFAVLGNDAGNRGRGPGPNASGQPGGFGDGGNAEPPPGEILDSIKRDMEEWSASGMWPYSSYRPTRADGDIPGFQDLSQEELRTEAYSAEKENRFDAYKSAFSASSSALQKKREMLAKPSQELKNFVISIYRGQMKAESLGGRSIFGGQEMLTLEIFIKSGSKLFQNSAASGGLSSPPTGLFSTPAAPSGTQTGGFGPATFGSSFGAQSTATPSSPPQGLFSNPSGPSSTGFSSATPSFGGSSGVFNKPAQPQTAPVPIGLFGKPAETQTAAAPIGLFGKPAEPQTTAAPIGLFGKPAESQTAAAPIGLFGKPAEPQTAGLFGKPVQSAAPTGLFGKPAAAVQGGGLFGKPTQATGLFGKPIQPEQGGQNVEAKWYTPLGDLTAEEKKQFEAASFTLGNIPTRPPPLELVSAAA